LTKLLRTRHIDALITVGAGDKMFWGRLAAWRAGLPVVASALHSTGWPDGIGRLNRRLTRITDAFIGVAPSHGQHLVRREGFPAEKVYVIPNGVDVERFRPQGDAQRLKQQLGIQATAPVLGIVAALRPEKNHELFLRAAQQVLGGRPEARFVIVGDGPERGRLEQLAAELGISRSVHFLGTRPDVHQLLSILDVFVLTSHIEANPVSILEAMAAGKPVIATRVGSIPDSVGEGTTGFLVAPGDAFQLANRMISLIDNPAVASRMGQAGRDRVVQHWSLEAMVSGYEELITAIYRRKAGDPPPAAGEQTTDCELLEAAHAAN
jgi:glycosyltransferase involved in cell wall biosynthesis